MSISYGTITITDTTDLGQLSVYLTGSTVRQQVYDNNGGSISYYPDWDTSSGHSGTALLITPHIYFNGVSQSLSGNNFNITWQKIEGGQTYNIPLVSPTETCPEGVVNNILNRPRNLATNSTGATYTATVTFYPIDGDISTTLQAIATLDLTIVNNGEQGAPAKSLQLISDGSYFTYHYDGSFFGAPTITLTAQKSNTVSGVHWYCKKATSSTYIPIKVINGTPSTDTTASGWSEASYYTTTSIEFSGEQLNNQLDILDLVPDFITDRSAQFKIVEIDSNGNEINNGLEDYTSIYALVEASPGQDTYSSYLSNDEETIIDLNGSPVLDNAQTQIFISQAGVDDLENWHITVTDSITAAADFVYTLSNSKDVGSSTTYLNKYGPDKVKVTTMNVNAALITFTAEHGIYNGNTFVSDATNASIPAADKVANIVKTFSLTKSAAIVSHSLRLDTVSANKTTGGAYSPTTVEIDAITRMAGGTEAYRNNGVISAIIHLVGGSLYNFGTQGSPIYYTSNTTNQPLKLTLSTYGDIDYIDTYLGGTYNSTTHIFEDAEDKQKIVISRDGTSGTSPWNFILSNQFDAISTDFSNNTSNSFTIILPIKAMEGTTEKTIHLSGTGATYPIITAQSPILSTITPKYYNGNTQVTTANSTVTNVRYTINTNTNIGATGSITLTLTYAENQTLTQTYTYKAQPEALKPIRILLETSPSNIFENQEGTITITPMVISGTEGIPASNWSNPSSPLNLWEAYSNGSWVNATTITGITMNNSTKVLSVDGTAVDGYLGLRFNVKITKGGITETYTEYVNLEDWSDPLQVTLHSTVGVQLVNGQGVGVIYARVVRRGDNEDYDTVVSDNMLAVGTSAPTSSTASGKTGYCYIVLDNNNPPKPTGEIRYYWRSQGSGSWSGYRGSGTSTAYKYKYTWTFRDSQNNPYVYQSTPTTTPVPINYLLQRTQDNKVVNNQQFVYVDTDTVNKKLTADVKVEL